ncbi:MULTISPECIES: G5 domain-containing protein [unclassified Microbacterium]|uniref:G5 domain-containing protein n=1 Tax=Microbacterium TaxID=33882 RepID=UPI003B9FB7B3
MVALVPLILLSPVIAPIALIVVITGIVGWSRGTRTWMRFRSKKAAAVVTVAATIALLVTGSVTASIRPPAEGERASFADVRTSDRDTAPRDDAGRESPDPVSTPTSGATPSPTPTPTVREEVVTEQIAFERVTQDDINLPQGQTLVSTPGQPGERTLTYRVTELEGKELQRELLSDVVTVEPVTEVTSVGTYVAPEPAPPAAPEPGTGCDPNYADACVPVATDVDCAGGGGNGPAYFDGVARIVGSDIYELDRDGDGYACEPS